MKLKDYTQFLGITEQSIEDYFSLFPKNKDGICKRLRTFKKQ